MLHYGGCYLHPNVFESHNVVVLGQGFRLSASTLALSQQQIHAGEYYSDEKSRIRALIPSAIHA